MAELVAASKAFVTAAVVVAGTSFGATAAARTLTEHRAVLFYALQVLKAGTFGAGTPFGSRGALRVYTQSVVAAELYTAPAEITRAVRVTRARLFADLAGRLDTYVVFAHPTRAGVTRCAGKALAPKKARFAQHLRGQDFCNRLILAAAGDGDKQGGSTCDLAEGSHPIVVIET